MTEQMNVGIVGAVTRGSGFARSLGLTGLASQLSIENEGVWLEVPDSRMWTATG